MIYQKNKMKNCVQPVLINQIVMIANMIREVLSYVGKNRNHYGKASDIKTST